MPPDRELADIALDVAEIVRIQRVTLAQIERMADAIEQATRVMEIFAELATDERVTNRRMSSILPRLRGDPE
jgi:hypothetical protein